MTGSSWALSLTLRTLGTSTSMPNSMTCAVSINMIRSTSTTSTKGVTLISARAPMSPRERRRNPLLPLTEIATLVSEAPLGHVQKFERKIVHAGAHFLDNVPEMIVENRGRDGGGEAHRGGDQRLGNARPDGAQARTARNTQVLEGLDDAEHSAEQADEGAHRRGGGQPVHVALQSGELLADAKL